MASSAASEGVRLPGRILRRRLRFSPVSALESLARCPNVDVADVEGEVDRMAYLRSVAVGQGHLDGLRTRRRNEGMTLDWNPGAKVTP